MLLFGSILAIRKSLLAHKPDFLKGTSATKNPRGRWRLILGFGLGLLGLAVTAAGIYFLAALISGDEGSDSAAQKVAPPPANYVPEWISNNLAMTVVAALAATYIIVVFVRRRLAHKKDDHGGSKGGHETKHETSHGGSDHGHGHGMSWQQAFVWVAAIVAIPLLVSSCQNSGIESRKLDIEARERDEKQMQEARVKSLRTCGRQGAPACICQGENTEAAVISDGEFVAVMVKSGWMIDFIPDISPQLRFWNDTLTEYTDSWSRKFLVYGTGYIENRTGNEVRLKCEYRPATH